MEHQCQCGLNNFTFENKEEAIKAWNTRPKFPVEEVRGIISDMAFKCCKIFVKEHIWAKDIDEYKRIIDHALKQIGELWGK